MHPRPALALTLLAAALAAPGQAVSGPALSLNETMPGWLTAGSDRFDRSPASQPARLTCRLFVPDVDPFFADPDHPMQLTGILELRRTNGWKVKLPIQEAHLRFLAPGASPHEKLLVYRFWVETEAGSRTYFEGIKTLRDDPGADAVHDATNLYVTLRRGSHAGPTVGAGKLRFHIENPLVLGRFVSSLKIHGAKSWRERLRVRARYLKLYLGTLYGIYVR